MKKILLINDSISGVVSAEKTFWSVLAESFFEIKPISLNLFNENLFEYIWKTKPSIIIVNSIIGSIKTPPGVKKIVLLQDNFKLMKEILPISFRNIVKNIIYFGRRSYAAKIKKQEKAIAAADVVVAVSTNVANSYNLPNAVIIPVGTDTKLFSPLNNREELKIKYGLPLNKKIKIFVGSTHSVKGFDILKKEITADKESFYILVLKDKWFRKLNLPNVKVFQRVSQSILSELYNCADIYIGRSRVETLWLTPIEAMFCNVPVDVTPVGIFADWQPENKNPRQEAFTNGLDRETMIRKWQELIAQLS